MSALVFRGGTVVDEHGLVVEDILVEDGIVSDRGCIRHPRAEVVDCEGRLILPGLVDPHVHFCLEVGGISVADDVEWGTRSAVAGGVTTVADFVPPLECSLPEALAEFSRRFAQAACDWVVHVVLARFDPATEHAVISASREGELRSVKVFTTYRDRGLLMDDEALFGLLECSSREQFVVLVHAENDGIVHVLSRRMREQGGGALALARSRPPEAEEEAVCRILALVRATGGKAHLVHLSSPASVDLVPGAREQGAWVSCETCPHYLVLTEEVLNGPQGHRYATVPPLRTAALTEALWARLARGDIQIVATDSCGFSTEAKDAWGGDFLRIPGGIPGVELSLRIMVTEGVHHRGIRVSDLVRLMSANPARLLGIYPRKGSLARGSDADIVILDPAASARVDSGVLVSRAGWSPYEGFRAVSAPERVYLRGNLVARQGRYLGDGIRGLRVGRGHPACPL